MSETYPEWVMLAAANVVDFLHPGDGEYDDATWLELIADCAYVISTAKEDPQGARLIRQEMIADGLCRRILPGDQTDS